MDELHLHGVLFIQKLQENLSNWTQCMLLASHLGDPRNAFLVFFPIAYFCNRSLGVSVMWAAAVSEWLNAIFKWLLFGHRPYWWVNVSDLYTDERPGLQQFELTCETGPGSPSGHAMVTSTALYILTAAAARYLGKKSFGLRMLPWVVFAVYMVSVCISRCYIATHFPHQVVAGTITGMLLGYLCERMPFPTSSFSLYPAASFCLLLSGPATIWLVQQVGWDPSWTIELAKRWCARAEWVYLDTTPLYALTRDASQLLGLGLALQWDNKQESASAPFKVLSIVSSIAFTRGLEHVKTPQPSVLIFYALSFLRNMLVPMVVMLVVPKLWSFMDTRKAKNS